MSARPSVIAIAGAGAMGSGIAQLAAQAGARTLVHDPAAAALERGVQRAREGIAKLAAKGRADPACADLLEPVSSLDAFAPAGLVIEAAPERLELKHELFGRLAAIVGEDCVLATNTSSLSVTAIAAPVPHPERVVGMHFFNPPPLMKLLEVVPGDDTARFAVDLALATGEAMGRHVITAQDSIGFVVNRCNRPFGLEAARLVQEGVATPEQVDRICRMGAGFRMGPFELADLVGIDVGFAVARSFWEQSFHEPRWQPSVLTARLVAAGRLGRKTGRGWYAYPEGPPADPAPPEPGDGGGRLVILAGDAVLADEIGHAASEAGFSAARPAEAEGQLPWLILDCGPSEDEEPVLQGGPQALLLDRGRLASLDPEGGGAGFYCLGPFEHCRLVELVRSETTTDLAANRTEELFRTLGRTTEWVGDAPGCVSGRIVCQLVNEACFAAGEGVGTPEDIDAGMVLGLNHPRGPFSWAEELGLDHVAAVLEALWEDYREERYRLAPALPRALG